VRKMLERFRLWLVRSALRVTTEIDYSLKKGEEVVLHGQTPMYGRIVGINWALRAMAVQITFTPGEYTNKPITVLPIWVGERLER
jgi:hypothetical protein